ncbi:MAG: ABC transporter permease [Candidatus Izemoplasmatales bacterium]|jgi:simple sugar transport system permease protein
MNKLKAYFAKVKQRMIDMKNQPKKPRDFSPILNSVISILFGLLVGFLIMLAVNPENALGGLAKLLTGGSATPQMMGNTFFKAGPLILVGLAVAFAFKTGLFNIGVSGQFMVSGVATLYVANLVVLPAPWHWMLAILAGVVAGAIWAGIPGLLKAFFNVNEVIATIMMNYIGMYLCVIMAYNAAVYNTSITAINAYYPTANTPTLGMSNLFPGSNIDLGIILAIIVAVIIWFLLKKTTLGYQLKAVGYSVPGSKYAGINYRRNVIISMMISGALAGLAAAITYLAVLPDYLRPVNKILSIGFEGISVALIAQSNPLGIIFSGVLISYIKQGALTMQLLGFDKEITNIVVAVIIYMIGISSFLGAYIKKRRDKHIKAHHESEEDAKNV